MMGTVPEGCFKIEIYVQEHSQLHHDLDAHREIRHQKYGQAALDILADWSERLHQAFPQWMMEGPSLSPSNMDQSRQVEEEKRHQEEDTRQRIQDNVKKSKRAMKWS